MEESKATVTIPISEWNELQQKLSAIDVALIKKLKVELEQAKEECRKKSDCIDGLERDIEAINNIRQNMEKKWHPLQIELGALERKVRGLERENEKLDNYNTELISDLSNVKTLKWLFYLSAFFNLVLLGSIIALWLRGESEVILLFMLVGGVGSMFAGLTVREEFKEQRKKYGK